MEQARLFTMDGVGLGVYGKPGTSSDFLQRSYAVTDSADIASFFGLGKQAFSH